MIDFSAARQYAVDKLSTELQACYTYHSLAHTIEDVAPAALRLGAFSNCTQHELLLLQTAALYHDIGFTVAAVDHEQTGVSIAAAVLPQFGYSDADLESIRQMIMATHLPQQPSNLLAQILCDADLDVLGRYDFLERNLALLAETRLRGASVDGITWMQQQLQFFDGHSYHTEAARLLREQGKRENYQRLQQLIAAAAADTNFHSSR